jgi:hypothetical protein
MPNICQNKLEVGGNAKVIEQFANLVKRGNKILSFESVLPTPPEMLTEEASVGSSPAWYTWRCENWGTKWDVMDCLDVEKERECNKRFCVVTAWLDGVYFETAWSPPSFFVEKVASLYPDLTFVLRFYEGGAEFAGEQYFENGSFAFEYIYEDSTSEEYKEFVTEHFGYEDAL